MGSCVGVGIADATGRQEAFNPACLAAFRLAGRPPDSVASNGTARNKGRRRGDGSVDRLHGEQIAKISSANASLMGPLGKLLLKARTRKRCDKVVRLVTVRGAKALRQGNQTRRTNPMKHDTIEILGCLTFGALLCALVILMLAY